MAFLDHLERQRHNSVRSRNARLAALRSFLKFAAHRDVASLQVIERALGVPVKRFERQMFGYLSREEMLAVIGSPDESWISQRDHVLFLLMYNTGARVSEITEVKVGEVVLDEGSACIHLHGKGRKQRSVPLWRSTVKAVKSWLRLNPQFDAASPLLPSRNSHAMTRNNVVQRLALAVAAATENNPDWQSDEFLHIRSGTPLRCIYCRLASTSASSPFGSAMKVQSPRITTLRQI